MIKSCYKILELLII